MSTRPSRVRILVGAVLFALLALLLVAPNISGQAAAATMLGGRQFAPAASSATVSPSVTQPTATGQKSGVSLVKVDKCAKAPEHGSDPYIEFCAPSFDGNVEGPAGSHVTLMAGNFKALPVAIYLAAAHGPGVLSQVGCVLPNGGCLNFDNGSDMKSLVNQTFSSDFDLSFTWSFPAASETVGSDYTLVVEEQGDKTVASRASFTLLSATAPCIAVSASGAPPDCTNVSGPAQPLQVLAGQDIQIAGSGWLPGDKAQTVDITLQCATCSPSHVQIAQLTTTSSDQPNAGGQLGPKSVALPSNVTGQYSVVAANQDKSETFGDADAQKIMLSIVAHPCIALSGNCVWTGSDTPQSMAKGQSATIMLKNWKSDGKVNVFLVSGAQTAQGCKPSATLGKQQSLSPSSSSIGPSFSLPSSLQIGKTYTICAIGPSPIGNDMVTAALQVKVTKAVAHPLFSLLSLLGLLFGLVGVGAYVLSTRQRAPVPQPVARR